MAAALAFLLLAFVQEGTSQSAPAAAPPPADATAADGPRVCGRPASDWLRDLKSDVMQARRLAGWAFTKLGPSAKEAVAALTAALEDEEPTVRSEAADALGAMGAAAAPAIPKLVDHLDDLQDCLPFTQPIDEVRKHAAAALAQIGAPSVAALAEALAAEKKTLRIGAALALSQMAKEREAAQPAVAPLRQLFLRREVEQKFAAALALVAIDPPANLAAAFLVGAARGDDAGATALAIEALEGRGPSSIALLEPLLGLDGGLARVRAAEAIVHLDPKHAKALALLDEAVRSAEPGEAAVALEALGRARGAAAVPTFRAALDSPDSEARVTAAVLRFVHDPKAADRSEPFLRTLADPSDEGCRFALSLLRQRAGADARPLLEELLGRERRAVRVAAASELLEIDPNHAAASAVMDAAMKRYTDPAHDPEVARNPAPDDEEKLRAAVAAFAAAAAKKRAQLVRMTAPPEPGEDPVSRYSLESSNEFERALLALPSDGNRAVPYLKPLLSHSDPGVRLEVAELLIDRIPDDPEPLRVMIDALRDPVDSFWVGERLADMGRVLADTQRPRIAAALRAALKDDDLLMRLAAARPLLRVEPGDRETLLVLMALLPEKSQRVGERAAMQLGDALVKDPSGLVANRLAELIADPATEAALRTRCAKMVVEKLSGHESADLRTNHPELVASATSCLERSCKEGDPKSRADAAVTLIEALPRDPVAFATLVELLGSSDSEAMNHALWALLQHGEPFLVQLTRLVLDPGADRSVRARAAGSIGGMGGIAISSVCRILKEAPPDCRRMVLELADNWDDSESRARLRARRGDGSQASVRSTRGELILLLKAALKDEEGDVRAVAAEKLFDLDHSQASWSEAYETALAELDASEGRRCFAVAQRFRKIGHRTGRPSMTEDPSGADLIARGLLRSRMTKELEARIVDPKRTTAMRMAAAQALVPVEGGVARLVKLTESADATTVASAAYGLGFADGYPDPKPAAREALQPLLEASQRGADRWVELRAAESLLQLGRETAAAEAKLEELAALDDARLAAAARETLEQFRKQREASGR